MWRDREREAQLLEGYTGAYLFCMIVMWKVERGLTEMERSVRLPEESCQQSVQFVLKAMENHYRVLLGENKTLRLSFQKIVLGTGNVSQC